MSDRVISERGLSDIIMPGRTDSDEGGCSGGIDGDEGGGGDRGGERG